MTDTRATKDREALKVVEPILSLLHHRGIVDTNANREDVAKALTVVRDALGIGGNYFAKSVVERPRRWPDRFREWPF